MVGRMTPDLLRRIGQAMYGERWQTALAHDLGMSDRRVRGWALGEGKPRPGVIEDLRVLLEWRREELIRVAAELERLHPGTATPAAVPS